MTDERTQTAKGEVLIAHPSKVAQAHQRAAEHGVERVVFKKSCPPHMAYIVDLDYLTRWPLRPEGATR